MIGEAEPSYWMVRDVALSIRNDLRTLHNEVPADTANSSISYTAERSPDQMPFGRQIMPS